MHLVSREKRMQPRSYSKKCHDMMLGLPLNCLHPCRLAACVTSAMSLIRFRAVIGCQGLDVELDLLELGAASLDHAICNAIIPARFVRVKFFNKSLELLWFNFFVKEWVNREDRVLHFGQCMFSTSYYPMGSWLIVGGLCMLHEMMCKGIPEQVPSLKVQSKRA